MKKPSNGSVNRKGCKNHQNSRSKSRAHPTAQRLDLTDRSQRPLSSTDASKRRRQRKFISEGPHVKNDQGTQSDISMADGTLWSMFPLCPLVWRFSDTASFPCPNNLDINSLRRVLQTQSDPGSEQDTDLMTERLEELKAMNKMLQ